MKVSLGEICQLKTGKTPPSKEEKYFNEGINWYTPSDLNNGKFLQTSNRTISNLAFEDRKATIFEKGTLLMTCIGEIGKLGITSGKCSSNQQITGLIPNQDVSVDYLYYALMNFKPIISEKANNAVVPIINNANLSKQKIPLPPLPTQKKIAQILDQADALRKNTQELIEQYDKLAQSIFLDMFGDPVINSKDWKIKKLGDICGVGSSKRVFVDELVESGIPFYRGTEIGRLGEDKKVILSLFIKEEHYEQLKSHTGVPKIGDLLLPSICPDGRIHEVKDNEPFYFKDGRVLWIKVDKENINSIYLKKFLKVYFNANYSKIASGTTFAELKIVILKQLKVLFPPIELQNQFAKRIQYIEQQKALAQQSLKESEDLFNNLLQKAFKGELVN